ncbi:MAG: hypothetical protein LWX83_08110 [Anaerolineae bacterium]|nr:hypothetical protein [Anaerolineae bacterium]
MDVIPSENNPRIAGSAQKDIQSPLSSKEVLKRSKKETTALQDEKQGDLLDVSSVATTKKDESALPVNAAGGLQASGFDHGKTLSQMKSFIMDQSSDALEAQVGKGASFIKSLYD